MYFKSSGSIYQSFQELMKISIKQIICKQKYFSKFVFKLPFNKLKFITSYQIIDESVNKIFHNNLVLTSNVIKEKSTELKSQWIFANSM